MEGIAALCSTAKKKVYSCGR